MLAVPRKFVNKRLLAALFKLPAGIFSFFKVLLKSKGANKTFIHTPHGEPADEEIK